MSWSERVLGEVNKVFVGQRKLVRGVLASLLAEGHVLIESVPGLGKTLLVRVLGRVLGCSFNRIQFTPDLMPSDVTGSPIYDERMNDFRFRPARSSPSCCWPTRSIGHRPRPIRPCWRSCRKTG